MWFISDFFLSIIEHLVSFDLPKGITICKDRLSQLFIGFFSFYSDFDFAKKIISLHEGGTIDRSIHSAEECLLPPFEQNIEFNPDNLSTSTMCIKDTFMTSRNVTQSVDHVDVINFKQYCEEQQNLLRIMGGSIRY